MVIHTQIICWLICSPTWLTFMTCGSAVSESEVNSVIALTDCDLWLMGWRRIAFFCSLWTDKLPVTGILSRRGWLGCGGGGEERKMRILCQGFTQTWYSYLRRLTSLPLAILWRLAISAPVAHTVVCSGEVKYRLSMYNLKVEWEKISSCVYVVWCFVHEACRIKCLLWNERLFVVKHAAYFAYVYFNSFQIEWIASTGYFEWKCHWRACGSIMY